MNPLSRIFKLNPLLRILKVRILGDKHYSHVVFFKTKDWVDHLEEESGSDFNDGLVLPQLFEENLKTGSERVNILLKGASFPREREIYLEAH